MDKKNNRLYSSELYLFFGIAVQIEQVYSESVTRDLSIVYGGLAKELMFVFLDCTGFQNFKGGRTFHFSDIFTTSF